MSVEVETSLQLSSEGEIFVRSYYCDRMINEAYDHPRHAIGAQSDQSKPGRPHDSPPIGGQFVNPETLKKGIRYFKELFITHSACIIP